MIRAGVLVLLFVAYQLWGTGLATARAQDRLSKEFAEQQAALATSTTTSSTTPTTDPGPVTTLPPVTAPADLPIPEPGDPVGRIRIPAIGVDFIMLQGVDLKWLKEGPGHFPQTPLPGQPGNAALAGHRTTYKAPFNRIDELQPGDEIDIETLQGNFTYVVDAHDTGDGGESGHFIVSPTQVEILDQDVGNRLTLMACHPKYSASQRIVVTATLGSPPAPPTPVAEPSGTGLPDENGGVTLDASLDALAGGDSSAWPAAIGLTLLALGIWFGTWYLARHWMRIPAYVIGTPIFIVVMFFAYENIARLLPASY